MIGLKLNIVIKICNTCTTYFQHKLSSYKTQYHILKIYLVNQPIYFRGYCSDTSMLLAAADAAVATEHTDHTCFQSAGGSYKSYLLLMEFERECIPLI